ncbi:MAG: YbjN domain-containing protein [Gemmatimonadetes bacterium]|nr:YbjN domain-containing protein [Gemmatimonadota bacterium]
MEFRSEGQRVTYEQVRGLMEELFGDFTLRFDDSPVIRLVMGSAVVDVRVLPLDGVGAVVQVRAVVVTGAKIRGDLLEYLLRENGRMPFGAFSLSAADEIVFEHGIVGPGCDSTQLYEAVMAVSTTADAQDNAIVARWGGQRAVDRMGG